MHDFTSSAQVTNGNHINIKKIMLIYTITVIICKQWRPIINRKTIFIPNVNLKIIFKLQVTENLSLVHHFMMEEGTATLLQCQITKPG